MISSFATNLSEDEEEVRLKSGGRGFAFAKECVALFLYELSRALRGIMKS